MTRLMKIWFDGEGGAADGGAADGAAVDKGGAVDGGKTPAAVTFDDNFDFGSVMPADLKEDKTLAKFSTHKGKSWVENVARSLVSAQGMIGADPNELVRVPADTSKLTMQDRNKFMERVGLPKDEKAWQLKPRENPVEGMDVDAPMAKWFQTRTRELGIFPDQAQQLWDDYGTQMGEALKLQSAQFAAMDKQNIEALQKEFGKDFDPLLVDARNGAKKLGGDEFVKRIGQLGLGTDPVFVKAMAKFGRMVKEGSSAGDKDEGANSYASGSARAQGMKLLGEAAAIMDSNPTKARELNQQAQDWFAKAVA